MKTTQNQRKPLKIALLGTIFAGLLLKPTKGQQMYFWYKRSIILFQPKSICFMGASKNLLVAKNEKALIYEMQAEKNPSHTFTAVPSTNMDADLCATIPKDAGNRALAAGKVLTLIDPAQSQPIPYTHAPSNQYVAVGIDQDNSYAAAQTKNPV